MVMITRNISRKIPGYITGGFDLESWDSKTLGSSINRMVSSVSRHIFLMPLLYVLTLAYVFRFSDPKGFLYAKMRVLSVGNTTDETSND